MESLWEVLYCLLSCREQCGLKSNVCFTVSTLQNTWGIQAESENHWTYSQPSVHRKYAIRLSIIMSSGSPLCSQLTPMDRKCWLHSWLLNHKNTAVLASNCSHTMQAPSSQNSISLPLNCHSDKALTDEQLVFLKVNEEPYHLAAADCDREMSAG